MLDSFVGFASKELGLDMSTLPDIQYRNIDLQNQTFGGYNPSEKSIKVITKNRHPMDIFRTVAHELIHHKQNLEGRIKDVQQEGSDGSPIENEANSFAGVLMRRWAALNPTDFGLNFVTEETLVEDINDPALFKAVFMAGGPGSGKDWVLHQTLDGHGLTEINSDIAFEFLMDKEGLDKTMPESEKVQRDPLRGKAKNITKEKERLALAGRKGLIINGTADDPVKISKIKRELELLGYQTMMVFVDTENDVSRERNIERGKLGGRTVPEDIRQEKWSAAQAAKDIFKDMFGENAFISIDNSVDIRTAPKQIKEAIQAKLNMVFKMVRKFTTAPLPPSPTSGKWIDNQMSSRNISGPVQTRSQSFGSQKAVGTQDTLESQAKKMGLTYYGFGRYGRNIGGQNVVTHISQNGRLVPRQQYRNLQEEYVVRRGDTLSAIAKRLGTTVDALAKSSGIRDVNRIQVGQRINAPVPTPATPSAALQARRVPAPVPATPSPALQAQRGVVAPVAPKPGISATGNAVAAVPARTPTTSVSGVSVNNLQAPAIRSLPPTDTAGAAGAAAARLAIQRAGLNVTGTARAGTVAPSNATASGNASIPQSDVVNDTFKNLPNNQTDLQQALQARVQAQNFDLNRATNDALRQNQPAFMSPEYQTQKALQKAVSDEAARRAMSLNEKVASKLFNENCGAGFEGTNKLRRKYQEDTPGQYKVPVNESVRSWMFNEETLTRFKKKYGNLAESKLLEAATNLDRMVSQEKDSGAINDSSSKEENHK